MRSCHRASSKGLVANLRRPAPTCRMDADTLAWLACFGCRGSVLCSRQAPPCSHCSSARAAPKTLHRARRARSKTPRPRRCMPAAAVIGTITATSTPRPRRSAVTGTATRPVPDTISRHLSSGRPPGASLEPQQPTRDPGQQWHRRAEHRRRLRARVAL